LKCLLNNSYAKDATKVDYLITNKQYKTVTEEWIVRIFFQRNYIEKNSREAKVLRIKRILTPQ
jgi:hypothetical protein